MGNDLFKPHTQEQRARGGVARSGNVQILASAIATGEIDQMLKKGILVREIIVKFGVSHTSYKLEMKRANAHKIMQPFRDPVLGDRVGDLFFEKTIHGKTKIHLFRHRCGWRESFTEYQLKEATI
jgi:hypothetical protein